MNARCLSAICSSTLDTDDAAPKKNAPVNAPSAFHWKKLDASTVEVVQKFTGEDVKPQTYAVLLKRVT